MKKTTKKKQTHETYTYEEIKQNKKKQKKILGHIKKHGKHTLAYSTLQPGMNYHIQKEGIIAYKKNNKQNKTYILGDPITGNPKKLINEFLNQHPKVSFIQVSHTTAKILRKKGYYSTPLGVETELDLATFEITGKERKNLRNHIRNCKKEVFVHETKTVSDNEVKVVKEISEDWLRNIKNNKDELKFLTRPLEINSEDTRTFLAKNKAGKIIGFGVFNPLYEKGKLQGYTADVARFSKDAPRGIADFINYQAIKTFKKEGLRRFSLGLSPLAGLEEDKLNIHSKPGKAILKLLYNYGNKIYDFKGLEKHKKTYGGKRSLTYVSHKEWLPLLRIYETMRISNAI